MRFDLKTLMLYRLFSSKESIAMNGLNAELNAQETNEFYTLYVKRKSTEVYQNGLR